MSDARIGRLDAIRRYLRRTKTLTQLQTLADALISTDVDEIETVFVNVGFSSSNASALLRGVDRFDVLGVVEELISEMVNAGVTSWTAAESAENFAQIFKGGDYSGTNART